MRMDRHPEHCRCLHISYMPRHDTLLTPVFTTSSEQTISHDPLLRQGNLLPSLQIINLPLQILPLPLGH